MGENVLEPRYEQDKDIEFQFKAHACESVKFNPDSTQKLVAVKCVDFDLNAAWKVA